MSQKRKVADVQDEDASISLQDVIDEDQEMEETVDAVLGGSDDQACTYEKGYVKRQALYACYTCTPSDLPPAGICLACSLDCHSGHDLYELYTKRNFRCDCGNDKFLRLSCKLCPNKDGTNPKNIYNQNFQGLYCTCHRPYPDEEDDVEDEMHQCSVCEDWFHGRHLGSTSVPSGMGYYEMICFDCSKRCTFLHKYGALLVAPIKLEKDYENVVIEVTDQVENQEKLKEETEGKVDIEETNTDTAGMSCKILGAVPVKMIGATFWPAGWREVLCRCKDCLNEYEKHSVSFLLDESDTVKTYEDEGKRCSLEKKASEQANALQGMSRYLQVEMLNGLKDMKEGFYEHFKKFAEEGKVVTEDDIKKFFSSLKNKRQKLDMPYSCR